MDTFFRRPGLIVAVILVITTFFALQIPDLEINNNIKIFIPDDNPSRVAYEDLKDTFGSQEQVDIAVTSDQETILRPHALETIREITERLESLDTVVDVQSVTNADFIEGTDEGMRSADLLEEGAVTSESISELRRRILTWPDIYEDSIISQDFRSTQILVDLLKDAETDDREEFYAEAKAIISEYEDSGLQFYMAGDPVITVLLREYMLGDLLYLIPMVTIVVLLALFLSFRNAGGVVLPIITVLISTVWALGVMSLFDIYFSMISTVIPVLLIAVGSAYVIHIFNHYYDAVRSEEGEPSRERHRELVLETIRKIGTPVAMSALTTAAGFASIATSAIVPMQHFGIINAVGVVSALVITLTFVPALLLIRRRALRGQGVTRGGNASAPHEDSFSRALLWFYRYFSGRAPRIIFLSLIIVAVSVFGLTGIVVDNSMIEYFDRDSEIRVADRFIRENFSGTKTFSIVVSGEDASAMTDPDALQAMDDLKGYLAREHEEVGKVASFSDFVRRMNQVMNVPSAPSVDGADSQEGPSRGGDGETGTADSDGGGVDSFFDEGNGGGNGTADGTAEDDAGAAESAPAAGPETEPTPAASEADLRIDNRPSFRELFEAVAQAYGRARSLEMSTEEFMEVLFEEFNFQGAAYDEIPTDPEKYPVADKAELQNLISQYLLLYSGNLDDFADDSLEPRSARMYVVLEATNSLVTERVSESAKEYAERHFPDGYDVSIAGFSDMESAVTRLIVNSQLWSLFSALVVVFVIVSFANRSPVAGIYGIVPLSLAILINFGVMGLADIKLNVATAMIASIAIGIGIDYTIHFLARYRIERGETDDRGEATKRTILTTGKAILYNAFAVGAGFAVLIASNFNPLRYVGVLVALTMLTSSLAALTVLPALLNLFRPRFIDRPARGGNVPSEERTTGGEQ